MSSSNYSDIRDSLRSLYLEDARPWLVGFSGGKDTHGVRAGRIPGSMGGSSDPSRVFKGKKLPGHFGDANFTVRGLEVLLVDPDKNVIFVKGAIPGARNGFVFVTKQA